MDEPSSDDVTDDVKDDATDDALEDALDDLMTLHEDVLEENDEGVKEILADFTRVRVATPTLAFN